MNHIIESYFGLGDNIWHIPFVHHLAKRGEVFIYTPFPELFQFENVYCFKPACNLKLQLKNMTGNGLYSRSSGKKPNGNRIRFNYGEGFKRKMNVIQSFESLVPLDGSFYFEYSPVKFKAVDDVMQRVQQSGKKLCVLRLPSVRKEWANQNRNGRMEYFQACINALKKDYYFVSVGDIGNQEEFDGVEPVGIDEKRDRYHVNPLGIWEVFDLVNRSDFVLSMQCNIMPIAQLLRKKAFIIHGGYVPHEMLTDPRLPEIGHAQPDPFCFCIRHGRQDQHRCKKDIPEKVLMKRLEDSLCLN